MLTWVFILTLYMKTMGGGGTSEITIRTTGEDLCKSMRKAIMQALKDVDGYASDCKKLEIFIPLKKEE